jgi:putative endonuclease
MGGDRKPLGQRGENVAYKTLKKEGYRVLEKNYQCRLGEIDLIARHGNDLVFIEVKSESGRGGILPKTRVDWRKQRKLSRLAQFYLKQKRLQDISARFDVVQVRLQDGDDPLVDIIENAFDLVEE